jgi:hypothetical protein
VNWFSRFLGTKPTPEQRPLTNTPALVTCGVKEQWGALFLCDVDADLRGVKIITIPAVLHGKYLAAAKLWTVVQGELEEYPRTLRPRRRSTRKAKEPEGVAG